jgi:hypothetical protein
MITAVTSCVPPTARASCHPQPYHAHPCPLPAGAPGRNRQYRSAITDSLPGGTRRAADRRTMRDSSSRGTLGLPRATSARMVRRSGQEEKEGRRRHANPERLTSRITAPPVRPAPGRTLLRTGLAAQAP